MRPRLIPLLMLAALLAVTTGCGGKNQTSPLETGGIDALDWLKTLNNRTTRILGEITGVQAAEAALPQLQAVSTDYDELIKQADKLSPAARQELADEAARIMPGLKANAVRIGSMKGAGELLAPTLQELVDKVARLQ